MSGVDTRSAILGLLIMGDGLHTDDWGDQTSTNLTILEAALGGRNTFNVTGGTLNLTTAQAANAILIFTGALTANQVVTVPNDQGQSGRWIIDNRTTGAFTLTFKTAGGTGVGILSGLPTAVYSDGTNILSTSRGGEIGCVEEYYGIELPSANYVWANGQLLSRTAYPTLFARTTRNTTLTVGSGATTVPCSEDLTGKNLIGATAEGPGVPTGTKITAITATTVTLSNPTTGATAAQTIRLFPYGAGDGATTFGTIDKREVVAVGASRMGGTAARGLISAATAANGLHLGMQIGEDRHTLAVGEMPSHNHTITDAGHSHGIGQGGHIHGGVITYTGTIGASSGANPSIMQGPISTTTGAANANITIQNAPTGISLAATGGGGSHNVMQPTTVSNFILRVA